jgi:hypothetical protein
MKKNKKFEDGTTTYCNNNTANIGSSDNSNSNMSWSLFSSIAGFGAATSERYYYHHYSYYCQSQQ